MFEILLIYVFIVLTVSYYFYITQPKQKLIKFRQIVLPSIVAVMILPLFFKSVGNPILDTILSGKADGKIIFFELSAYVAIAVLASKKIIDSTLDSLNLNTVKGIIKDNQKKIIDHDKNQELIISKQVYDDGQELDSEQKKIYLEILSEFNSDKKAKIHIKDANYKKHILDLENKRYINIFNNTEDEKYIYCTITKIGKEYLKQEKDKDFN